MNRLLIVPRSLAAVRRHTAFPLHSQMVVPTARYMRTLRILSLSKAPNSITPIRFHSSNKDTETDTTGIRSAQFREIMVAIGDLRSDVGDLQSDVGDLRADVKDLKERMGSLERSTAQRFGEQAQINTEVRNVQAQSLLPWYKR